MVGVLQIHARGLQGDDGLVNGGMALVMPRSDGRGGVGLSAQGRQSERHRDARNNNDQVLFHIGRFSSLSLPDGLRLSRTRQLFIRRDFKVKVKKIHRSDARAAHYTLNLNNSTSPSLTSYSLPSMRYNPFSRAAATEPHLTRSSYATVSALMKPRSKSL